jgi:hypothetical protein
MAATSTRTLFRATVGYQPVEGYARRYDAPAARTITRYDAPSSGSTRPLDAPAARLTQFRAPASRSGTTHTASDARRRAEIAA